MKINIKKLANFKWKSFFSYFVKQLNAMLLLVALLVTTYCVFLWYQTIYKPGWDNLQKQAYIKSKDKGTVFNKDKFEKMVAEYLAREEKRKKSIANIKDIFQLKK